MKRIIRLTEADLTRIVRRVINEQAPPTAPFKDCCIKAGLTLDTIPLDCRTEDYNGCIKSLEQIVSKDPLGMGVKAKTAIDCLTNK